MSATDKMALYKAVLSLHALRNHFRKLIAVKKACDIKPAIAYLTKAANAPAYPEGRSQGGVQGAGNSGGTGRAPSGGIARPEVETRRDPPRRDSNGNTGGRRPAGEGGGARGVSERPRQRRRRGNCSDDYVASGSKLLGMFAADNPVQAHLLLPQNSNACPNFCFKGLECKEVKTSTCSEGKRHFYAAKQMDMKDLEETGDSFLANNDGFFVAKAFRQVTMAPKRESFFESNNNRA